MTDRYQARRIGGPSRECPSCTRDLPLTSKYFPIIPNRPNGLGLTCRKCRARNGDNEGTPRKGKRCFSCEGYSWRRPENGEPCACGEYFAEEPPVTLAYGAQFTTDRTVFPETAGYE